MRSFSILIIILICSSFTIANIWTVDNNPTSIGDFTNLISAHTAASTGDTIYVFPSAIAYSAITVTKEIYFFGAGFDLELHGGQAYPTNTTISGTMIFNTGSEGSLMEGFDYNEDNLYM